MRHRLDLAPRPDVLERLRGASDAEHDDALARAFLGFLVEPGDGIAGRLVAAVGPVEAAALVASDPPPEALAVLLADPGEAAPLAAARAALERWRPRLDRAAFARSLEQAARVGATLLAPGDADWPAGLDDLGDHAPLALWVRGRPSALLDGTAVAIVGARAATSYGTLVAGELADGLAMRGGLVVSGGAYGIDGAAHRAALAAGGTTVAFLAGGVDRFYPAGHEDLLGRVAALGAVASEVPIGSAPTKWRFLQRNRLIAAAAAATVVVEAGHRSGSLNTAAHAAQLGRPLGAVPGPVTSPSSSGSHRLLREHDALCVTNAAEVWELAGGGEPGRLRGGHGSPEAGSTGGPSGERRDDTRLRVVDALSTRTPYPVAELARRAGLEPVVVRGALGRLALSGDVAERGGGWVRTG
ncbi:DNA-processing protein DprA [Agromyces seonyuensis]|uniref:DNA-protecting protein DprA n=1 Tax=Agromyces seonyuensis TaxID=2662446 RepID=A0A6I4P5D0_9MICO|nr:DNA-processing protein DprA [Agromyces seonyuensis]MWB98624.1 DNA-protecting protein DprA [Agromyces seonyuensis]